MAEEKKRVSVNLKAAFLQRIEAVNTRGTPLAFFLLELAEHGLVEREQREAHLHALRTKIDAIQHS